MANPFAGEVEVVLDGHPHVAKLTLGALAELEAALGEDSLMALVARFEAGRFSTRDVLALLVAGLRGGGWQGRAARCCLTPRSSSIGTTRLTSRLREKPRAVPKRLPKNFWTGRK